MLVQPMCCQQSGYGAFPLDAFTFIGASCSIATPHKQVNIQPVQKRRNCLTEVECSLPFMPIGYVVTACKRTAEVQSLS